MRASCELAEIIFSIPLKNPIQFLKHRTPRMGGGKNVPMEGIVGITSGLSKGETGQIIEE
jgi:hypothetical protein